MATIIKLAYPPSANALFTPTGRRGGRAKRAKYSAWIEAAGKEINVQRPHLHTECVHVDIAATPPDKRLRDIDNLIKPTLDLLVRHQIIQGDDYRFVSGVTARWASRDSAGLVVSICSEEGETKT